MLENIFFVDNSKIVSNFAFPNHDRFFVESEAEATQNGFF